MELSLVLTIAVGLCAGAIGSVAAELTASLFAYKKPSSEEASKKWRDE